MLVYREDLEDLLRRGAAGATRDPRREEVYLHCLRHPASPCRVHYRADVLAIDCAACNAPIVSLVIASRARDLRGLDPPDEEAVP